MAYMNQQKKKIIADALKTVVPKGWKYSLAVRNHSTIVMTIQSAPIDLIAESKNAAISHGGHLTLNPYHINRSYSGKLLDIFEKILKCLNEGNWDRSDIQTDYFDVGHYVDIQIGAWNKPFKVA